MPVTRKAIKLKEKAAVNGIITGPSATTPSICPGWDELSLIHARLHPAGLLRGARTDTHLIRRIPYH